MKDQHKKIKGYRDLSEQEIELMNAVKEQGEVLKVLINNLKDKREDQWAALHNKTGGTVNGLTDDQIQESLRCLHKAKTDLQQGMMWFVRSIALPDSF